jgi:hypothetical protein
MVDNQTLKHIAKLAYEYWQERGSPLGSPDIDWLRAEQHVEELARSWHLRENFGESSGIRQEKTGADDERRAATATTGSS